MKGLLIVLALTCSACALHRAPNPWIYVADGSGVIPPVGSVVRDPDGNFVWRDVDGELIDHVTQVRCRDYQRVAGPFAEPRICR